MPYEAQPGESAPRMNGASAPRVVNPHDLPIFPLRVNSKHPRDKEFWRHASPDTSKIPPGFNAGVVTGGGLLVIDLDTKGGKDGLSLWNSEQVFHDDPPTYTVRTPTGGRHLYFLDPLGRSFGQGTDRLGSGIDVKAHPHGYVVAPGSVIDGKPYEIVADAPIADAPQWLLDKLSRDAPRSRGNVDQVPVVELDTDENIALATKWLVDEAPEAVEGEGGNDTVAKIIAPALKDRGLSPERAFEVFLEHYNETKADPPWGARGPHELEELDNTIRSGYRSAKLRPPGITLAQLPHHEFPPLPPEVLAALDAQPRRAPAESSVAARAFKSFAPFTENDESAIPRLDFVYGDHFARGFATLTAAPPKVGKSLLTLAELVDAASGRGLLTGKPQPPRRALYINFEDNMDALRSRRAAIRTLHDIPPEEIDGRLGLISGVDQPDFYLMTGEGTVNEAAFAHLESEIARHGYDIVVLDPLQDASRADESNEVFRLLGSRLRETASKLNVAIGIIHHTRKTAPGQSNMTMDDARGGSALRGSCRFNRLLAPMTEEQGREARAKDPRVEDNRYFFRIGQAEGNMAPPSSELNRWFEKVSVPIANGARVGAVRRWTWPESLEGVTDEMAVAVREALTAKARRKDVRSPEWVGFLVAETCGFPIVDGEDEETGKGKRRAKAIVNTWLKDGVLVEERRQDEHGKEKTYIVPGPTDPLSKAPGGET